MPLASSEVNLHLPPLFSQKRKNVFAKTISKTYNNVITEAVKISIVYFYS